MISIIVSILAIISMFLALFVSQYFWILFAVIWLSLCCGRTMMESVTGYSGNELDIFYIAALAVIAFVGFWGGLLVDASCWKLLLIDIVLGIYFAILFKIVKNYRGW